MIRESIVKYLKIVQRKTHMIVQDQVYVPTDVLELSHVVLDQMDWSEKYIFFANVSPVHHTWTLEFPQKVCKLI